MLVIHFFQTSLVIITLIKLAVIGFIYLHSIGNDKEDLFI